MALERGHLALLCFCICVEEEKKINVNRKE